jgi:hypothetical protein
MSKNPLPHIHFSNCTPQNMVAIVCWQPYDSPSFSEVELCLSSAGLRRELTIGKTLQTQAGTCLCRVAERRTGEF